MSTMQTISNKNIVDRDDLAADASVGRALSHDSASRHVSGSAIYVDDIAEPVGCLHLAPGYADCARGTLR